MNPQKKAFLLFPTVNIILSLPLLFIGAPYCIMMAIQIGLFEGNSELAFFFLFAPILPLLWVIAAFQYAKLIKKYQMPSPIISRTADCVLVALCFLPIMTYARTLPARGDAPIELSVQLMQLYPHMLAFFALPVAWLAYWIYLESNQPRPAETTDKTISPLFRAVMFNDLEETKMLAQKNAQKINMLNGDGETVLHIAVRNDYEAIVKILLAQPGIDKNSKNKEGKTALDLAKEKHLTEMVQLLSKNKE